MIHPSGPPARAPAVGPEAVRQSFAGAWPNFAEWSVAVNDVRVRVSQEWAMVLATTPVHVKMRNSDTASDFSALATIVYERRDGRRLIVHSASRSYHGEGRGEGDSPAVAGVGRMLPGQSRNQ